MRSTPMAQSDLTAVKEESKRLPEDVDRRAFFAASLGILRSIRILVILCLLLELFGRILQVAYIYFPTAFPSH